MEVKKKEEEDAKSYKDFMATGDYTSNKVLFCGRDASDKFCVGIRRQY